MYELPHGFMMVAVIGSDGSVDVAWDDLRGVTLFSYMSDMLEHGERFEILEVHRASCTMSQLIRALDVWRDHIIVKKINQEGEEQ